MRKPRRWAVVAASVIVGTVAHVVPDVAEKLHVAEEYRGELALLADQVTLS